MSGNPSGSKWRSTPNERRGRPGHVVTMAPESWVKLDAMVADATPPALSRGELIERWIEAATDRFCVHCDEHDPLTLAPLGPQCGQLATQTILWRDGRYSPACDAHGFASLDHDARVLVLRVTGAHVGG